MPLQWRNRFWQNLEEGAGKRCWECDMVTDCQAQEAGKFQDRSSTAKPFTLTAASSSTVPALPKLHPVYLQVHQWSDQRNEIPFPTPTPCPNTFHGQLKSTIPLSPCQCHLQPKRKMSVNKWNVHRCGRTPLRCTVWNQQNHFSTDAFEISRFISQQECLEPAGLLLNRSVWNQQNYLLLFNRCVWYQQNYFSTEMSGTSRINFQQKCLVLAELLLNRSVSNQQN